MNNLEEALGSTIKAGIMLNKEVSLLEDKVGGLEKRVKDLEAVVVSLSKGQDALDKRTFGQIMVGSMQ